MPNIKSSALATICLATRVLEDARITPTHLDILLIGEARLAVNKGDYTRAERLASAAIQAYIETDACFEARAGILSVHA